MESTQTPRLNRTALHDLAQARLEDGHTLVANQRYAGAYYLAGYAIECGLKACIAKQTREGGFPPGRKTIERYYSHNLRELWRDAGIPFEEKLTDESFRGYWNLVITWSEQSRYDPEPL